MALPVEPSLLGMRCTARRLGAVHQMPSKDGRIGKDILEINLQVDKLD